MSIKLWDRLSLDFPDVFPSQDGASPELPVPQGPPPREGELHERSQARVEFTSLSQSLAQGSQSLHFS